MWQNRCNALAPATRLRALAYGWSIHRATKSLEPLVSIPCCVGEMGNNGVTTGVTMNRRDEIYRLTGLDVIGVERKPVPAPGAVGEFGRPLKRGWVITVRGHGSIALPDSNRIRRPSEFKAWRWRMTNRDDLPAVDSAICSRVLKYLFELSEGAE